MKYICSAILIVSCMLFCFIGCAENIDRDTTSKSVEESDYHIVFKGDTWPDVVFPHIDHVDREEGVCFRCHYCEKILGETNWDCRACHSPENEEGLCETDGLHGCTYTQCYNCHETLGNNPGLACIDCHQ